MSLRAGYIHSLICGLFKSRFSAAKLNQDRAIRHAIAPDPHSIHAHALLLPVTPCFFPVELIFIPTRLHRTIARTFDELSAAIYGRVVGWLDGRRSPRRFMSRPRGPPGPFSD